MQEMTVTSAQRLVFTAGRNFIHVDFDPVDDEQDLATVSSNIHLSAALTAESTERQILVGEHMELRIQGFLLAEIWFIGTAIRSGGKWAARTLVESIHPAHIKYRNEL